MKQKICTECSTSYLATLEYFPPDKRHTDGLHSWCRGCCREATRKSIASKPVEFSSKELMLKYAEALVRKRFNLDVNELLKHSVLLRNLKVQKKLGDFS